jgi:hypothetical protein
MRADVSMLPDGRRRAAPVGSGGWPALLAGASSPSGPEVRALTPQAAPLAHDAAGQHDATMVEPNRATPRSAERCSPPNKRPWHTVPFHSPAGCPLALLLLHTILHARMS